jgi:hypothetical protein
MAGKRNAATLLVPDGSLQDTGQVVWVELGGGLAQLSLQQVKQVPHDIPLHRKTYALKVD